MHKSSFEVLSKKKSRSSHRFRKITTVLYDICKIEWRNGNTLDSSPEDWGFDSLFFYCRLKAIVLLSIFLSLSPSLLKRNYVIIQEATQEMLGPGSHSGLYEYSRKGSYRSLRTEANFRAR